MYHGKLQSLVWDAMLVPRLMGTNMAAGNQQKHLEFTLAISKPFFSLLNFHTLTFTLLLHVSWSDLKKKTRRIDVFMYVTCLEQQSFCHALRRNLKFKLLFFQNKERYPDENKQADGNLDFLICDEDKNPKLLLLWISVFYDVMWKPRIPKATTTIKLVIPLVTFFFLAKIQNPDNLFIREFVCARGLAC